MNTNAKWKLRTCSAVVATLLLAWAHATSAQTFSSGSTGADGAFAPSAGGTTTVVVRPGGVYHYTTVNIPSNVTVRYVRGADNSPVVILASGNVTITGDIIVSGDNGVTYSGTTTLIGGVGASGGPGGFNGGMSGGHPNTGFVPTAGQGPFGGQASSATGGGGGDYGAPQAFVGLTPLFGGSGGAGGTVTCVTSTSCFGRSGGGGGGAILIASSTSITINGTISANGGNSVGASPCTAASGAGAGGAIRLVANTITGANSGLIETLGGSQNSTCTGTVGGNGRIRLEAASFAGFLAQTNPVPSIANAPGAVSAGGSPALVNVPSLSIASIGGLTVPTTATASYSVPDLTLAPGTANPIPVVVNAANTPVGAPTQITLRVTPRSPGTVTNVNIAAADHGGTFASSSATANVTLPAGQVTLLQAYATMTLTGQTAGLFPLIDGEPVQQVRVAASPGEASTLSLVLASGKEFPVESLTTEQRMQIARAWEILRVTRTE